MDSGNIQDRKISEINSGSQVSDTDKAIVKGSRNFGTYAINWMDLRRKQPGESEGVWQSAKNFATNLKKYFKSFSKSYEQKILNEFFVEWKTKVDSALSRNIEAMQTTLQDISKINKDDMNEENKSQLAFLAFEKSGLPIETILLDIESRLKELAWTQEELLGTNSNIPLIDSRIQRRIRKTRAKIIEEILDDVIIEKNEAAKTTQKNILRKIINRAILNREKDYTLKTWDPEKRSYFLDKYPEFQSINNLREFAEFKKVFSKERDVRQTRKNDIKEMRHSPMAKRPERIEVGPQGPETPTTRVSSRRRNEKS